MKLRSLVTGLALIATGTVIASTTQHFVSAGVSSGDRPVLVPITPCRLADTRAAPNTVGPRSAPIGAADTHSVDAQEAGTACTGMIPSDASALSLNITALGATAQSFLTIWAGGDRPRASSLNPAPGAPPVPNAVTTQLSVDQEFKVYNDAGTVNIVIDVNGYYVNHDHNDRYFTESEVNDRFYTRAEIDVLRPLVAYAAADPSEDITDVNTLVLEVSLDVPVPGTIAAAGSLGLSDINAEPATCDLTDRDDFAKMVIDEGVTWAPSFNPAQTADSIGSGVVSLNQNFSVGAGSATIKIVCINGAPSGSTSVNWAELQVIFIAD